MSDPELTWPLERLGEALEYLARRAGLAAPRERVMNPDPREDFARPDRLGRWVEQTAAWLGVEAHAVYAARLEVARLLAGDQPVLLAVATTGAPRFVALLRGGPEVVLIGPDFAERRTPAAAVLDLVCAKVEAPLREQSLALLETAGLSGAARDAACRRLVDERLGRTPVADAWVLRLAGRRSVLQHARARGLIGRLLGLTALETAHYALWLWSWYLIGRGALTGRIDPGWLVAWALALATLVPLRLLGDWWQAVTGFAAGALLRERLLRGALRLDTAELRRRGAAGLLSQVLESEAIERLAIAGGFLGLVAVVELALGALVLVGGAGGVGHAALLLTWLGVTAWLARRHLHERSSWTRARLELSGALVERMLGHRTVHAQVGAAAWAADHDRQLEAYVAETRGLDRGSLALLALVSRGWLLVGLAGLAPAAIAAGATVSLAIGIGGTLVVARSLRKLALSATQLAGAWVAWRSVAALLESAESEALVGAPDLAEATARADRDAPGQPLLEVRDVSYRHAGRVEATLRRCDLTLEPRARLLVTGASGSGKSTLAALLCGLRRQDGGLILLRGLDLPTLGERGWRRRAAGVFQFHENHVVTETLAFNLLMGRRWPATATDLADAERVCRQIGLGALVDRMPSGLQQIVGDAGWQLSHGERSRVYLARAILQSADLIVLDESFGALDPAALRQSMAAVRETPAALVVVAHP